MAFADPPRVVTDIAPVHGLVARVMEGVAEPDLLLPPGASPHGYALRPSEARALSQAEIFVWIGPELTPWLEDGLDSLAPDAARLELLEVEGIVSLPYRETAIFAAADAHDDDHDGHGHQEHGHDDHNHGEEKRDDHADHDHNEEKHDDHDHAGHDHGEEKHDDEDHAGHDHDEEKHDDHAGHDHGDEKHEEHAGHDHDHDDHDHSGTDPHAWLDPQNASVWVAAIAAKLSEMDPDNATTYAANAKAAQAELTALTDTLGAQLEPAQGKGFIVFHDAYQYFEGRFGLTIAGAIRLSDADAPSAARVAALRDRVAEGNIACVFTEPQYDANIVSALADATSLSVATIDPLGADIPTGKDFYPAMLTAMADQISGCF